MLGRNYIEEENDEKNDVAKEEYDKLLKDIEERCKKSNITFQKVNNSIDEEDEYEICMPSGRTTRNITLYNYKDAKNISEIDFENYILFTDYLAICSYSRGYIESYIQTNRMMPNSHLKKRLFGDIQSEEEVCATIEQNEELGNIKISIGEPSSELMTLLRYNRGSILSLKIEGLSCKTYDKSLKILEDIANSIFFQIDLHKNIPLNLLRGNRIPFRKNISQYDNRNIRDNLNFPITVYDLEAISLYSYARNSNGIPLLQYQAFYQTIEYYFSKYSEIEAKKTLAVLLKNPVFNPNSDKDITTVLTTVKSKISKNYDNERSQFKATLNECINIDTLKKYIKENKYLEDFYAGSDCKKLSKVKLNVSNNDEAFLNDIVERLYDIRCKIVHTKMGENDNYSEMLLPFSKEIEFLYFDIELIQYISQQVIIANGKELHI